MVSFVDESQHGPAPELSWGRHFLMCPPNYFDVSYSINFWMDPAVQVDRDRALQQWNRLVDTLRAAGAVVDEMPAQQGLPDIVFTANAGIVDGTTCWPARMRHPQRQPEIAHLLRWLTRNSWNVADPPVAVQEGAGDALPFAGTLVAGYGLRSSLEAYQDLAERAGWAVTALELADPRYYHIDLAFCPLDGMTALIVPNAFTPEGRDKLTRLVPDPVLATPEEGAMFCANSIVVDRTVIMPSCTPRLGRLLERRGFEVVVCDVSEFLKAGGGCRCLTLALDVSLTGGIPTIVEVAA
ncbi:MAG: dimethylarginine dimethylaminohydrolase family protein [Pseudonocardiaceae bacterium]